MFGIPDYLQKHGVTLADVVEYVRPLGRDEILLLVGSVAEGIANPRSDLDLLLLETAADRIPTRSDSSIVADAGFDLNVEVVPLAAAERLCAHVIADRRAFRELRDCAMPRSRHFVAGDDLRLLHRLRTGVPLLPGADAMVRFRDRCQLHALPEFCLVQHLDCHLSLRTDALAALDDTADPDTPLLMCQLATRRLLSAILAWIGETNPCSKWTVRLLMDHDERLTAFRPQELVDLLFPPRIPPASAVRAMEAASRQTIDTLITLTRPRDAQLADAIAALAEDAECRRGVADA